MSFNSDWIEKCLAHEDGRSSRRAPTKSSIHRFYQRHFLPQAARPVKTPAIPQDLTYFPPIPEMVDK
jgi:hypothetical protein